MTHFINTLLCFFGKHFYRPSYEMTYKLYTRQSLKRIRLYRYTCDCCDKKTPWMNHKEFEAFNIRYCPTWGKRGSDSQDYRGNHFTE